MDNLEHTLEVELGATSKHFKKKTILQRKGDLNLTTYYVKKGLVRSYIIDAKGKEHIYMFASEGWVIGDIESLEFNEPALLFIDCLEDSELLIFEKDCLFKANLPKETVVATANLLFRRIAVLQRRVLMLMSTPAIDRYNYFIKTYPDLPKRIPQHMIASYLGITPQALSTIRGKKGVV